MPLYGAVTKLTGLSPDGNGCTLWTLAVAAIPYRLGAPGVGRTQGEKNCEKARSREIAVDVRRRHRRWLKGEGEVAGRDESDGGKIGRDAKAEEGPRVETSTGKE